MKTSDLRRFNFVASPKLISDFWSRNSSEHASIWKSFFKDDSKNPNELVQIKELKIFISQKNLFKPNDLKITKILINQGNLKKHLAHQ